MSNRIAIPADGDWPALRRALALLSRVRLSDESSQTFANLTIIEGITVPSITLSGLTASQLVSTSAAKALESVPDLTTFIKQGTDITVTNEGDGTVTIASTAAGVTDHSELDNLAYALAGHTGFEPTIAAGTVTQYWRGDKTWQTLTTGGGGGVTKVADETERLALSTEEGDLVYQLDEHNLYLRVL